LHSSFFLYTKDAFLFTHCQGWRTPEKSLSHEKGGEQAWHINYLDLQKDSGYLQITEHFCLSSVKAADNRARLLDIFAV
jgi:hypothetical protein